MSFNVPFSIRTLNPVYLHEWAGPYVGATEADALQLARTSIPAGVRVQGLECTLIINGQSFKYWFRDGVLDNHLVPLVAGIGVETDPTVPSHVKAITSSQITNWDAMIPLTQKGQALGVASLDSSGKVPIGQLPSSLMELKGQWNAATNTPTLVDGVGDLGDVYEVTTPGTANLGSGPITFNLGDWVVYANGVWYKSINSNEVTLVNGQKGNVVLNLTNINDVTISTPVNQQLLKFNGLNWVNGSLVASDIPDLDMSKITTGNLHWNRIHTTPTTIGGYGITDAYTVTQVNNIFAGTTPLTGYNKTNWDTAFGWGNHASAGYVTASGVAGRIPFFSSATNLSTDVGLVWDNVNKEIQINGRFNLVRPAVNGSRESLLRMSTSDANGAFFEVGNATINDNMFIPAFRGYITNTLLGMMFSTLIPASVDASDSPNNFGLIDFFTSRTDNPTDPANGNITNVVNRRLLTLRNNTSFILTAFANGNVVVGNQTTNAGFGVDITGSLRVQGTLNTNLTSGRVPLIGTNGVLYTVGNLGWDNTNSVLNIHNGIHSVNHMKLVVGAPSNSAAAIGISSSSSNANDRGEILFIRTRGTSASPSVVANGDWLGGMGIQAFTGTQYVNSALVQFMVDGTPSASGVPGKIALITGTNSSDRLERITVLSNGRLGFNNTTPSGLSHFSGSITASSGIGKAIIFDNTIVANANNNTLTGVEINPEFTTGAFTGVTSYALRVNGRSLFTRDAGVSAGTHVIAEFFRISSGINNAGFGVYYEANGTVPTQTTFYAPGGLNFALRTFNGSSAFTNLIAYAATGNVGVATSSDAGFRLDVNGTARIISDLTTSGAIFNRNTTVSNISTGSHTLFQRATSVGNSMFVDYHVTNTSTNASRSGSLFIVWDATSVNSTDYSSGDINGSTLPLTLEADINSGNIRVRAAITSGTWTIKLGCRII